VRRRGGLAVRMLLGLSLGLAALSAAACQSGTPTPMVIFVTLPPNPTSEATPSPPPETATPGESPAATPTPEASETPEPTPSPTSAASFCTGTAANQAFFVEAAKGLKGAVYCATGLPAGWAIASGSWAGSSTGGQLTVVYRYRSTNQTFQLREGSFCTISKIACWGGPTVSYLSGFTDFDGMTAEIGELLDGSGAFVIAVGSGTNNAYIMTGYNVPPDTLAAFAADMTAVPKA
jgi:hypothetical protein